MHVISRKTIDAFIKQHADARDALLAWHHEAQQADWQTPHDIKQRYPKASFLADNTVIFNIKSNHYRLTVRIAYKVKTVYIERIETHAEYSKKK